MPLFLGLSLGLIKLLPLVKLLIMPPFTPHSASISPLPNFTISVVSYLPHLTFSYILFHFTFSHSFPQLTHHCLKLTFLIILHTYLSRILMFVLFNCTFVRDIYMVIKIYLHAYIKVRCLLQLKDNIIRINNLTGFYKTFCREHSKQIIDQSLKMTCLLYHTY